MCAEGMDGPVSTIQQSSHRGISQSSYSSGMGAVDEEISAIMLQSNHANMTGMMAPVASAPLDHLAAYQQAYAMYPPGLMQRPGAHVRPPHRRESRPRAPGFNLEEKYVLEAKSEVVHNYNPVYESAGLHRYHSAPSTFLQTLAEDAFAQIPGSNMFAEPGGLTPITEQMDVERGSGNDVEQFLAPDSEFSRRAALSALGKPENTAAELVRQKNLPGGQPRQDPTDQEHHSEESLSGTSEDNSRLDSKTSMHDDIFSRESWPTSPGTSKRPRGFPLESDPAENFRSGLIRHASLPTPIAAPSAVAAPSADDHYVQMRARAKRGCATHPRSIAERVRRTRISERMKKLQDLVPNMEKTTNTSDMLDETVEYVKSLKLQVAELQQTIVQLKAQSSNP